MKTSMATTATAQAAVTVILSKVLTELLSTDACVNATIRERIEEINQRKI